MSPHERRMRRLLASTMAVFPATLLGGALIHPAMYPIGAGIILVLSVVLGVLHGRN